MPAMNLGGRIRKRLDDLEQKPTWLCDQVNALSPNKELTIGNLSALINRDSKKSEFASVIAAALGVNLDWLLTGEGEEIAGTPPKENEIAVSCKPDYAWPFERISPQQWGAYSPALRNHAETIIMQAAIDDAARNEKHALLYSPDAVNVRKSSNGG